MNHVEIVQGSVYRCPEWMLSVSTRANVIEDDMDAWLHFLSNAVERDWSTQINKSGDNESRISFG